jgi:ferric-dicitrate binding protein FerR (iron transport regulator)
LAKGLWLSAATLLCAVTYGQDPAARVASLTGQVSVLRDSIPWALSVGDTVKPRQIILTGVDGFAVFQVSDGSTFEVFPNSRLIFRDNPGSWKDLVDVLIGRIKVHLQRLGNQPNYNRVRTPTAVISVRGTIFDVNVEDDDATTFVLVEEGQVEVRHSLLPQGGSKLLNAGEFVRVFRNQPLVAASYDRGSVLRRVLDAAREAVWVAVTRSPSGGASGGGTPVPGGGTGPVGDQKSPDPPPAPPPSAPPPTAAPPK